MAPLWLRLLLAVGLPIAALVAVMFLLYRRRSGNAPPELPEVSSPTTTPPGAKPPPPPPTASSPGLQAKLNNMRYNPASGRVGLRFQQLHQHQHHARHHRASGAAAQFFQWADHPRLVTEAAENGWAQFVFTVAPPPRSKSNKSSSASTSSPLWGTWCPLCDAGTTTSRDMAEAAAWELPAGSSERMQAVRLNAVTTAAATSGRNKWLPGSIPSPLRGGGGGDGDAAGNTSLPLCLARMSLPLPGPPLAGAPFPQEAYLEITIIYLNNTKRPEWSSASSRGASRRGARDGGSASESDRVKLISFAPDAKSNPAVHGNSSAADMEGGQQDKRRQHLVMSLGLATANGAVPQQRPSLPGTYASSIGFHSDGAVYLDGMKLVYESDKSSWAGVDKVVGCGFEPARRKVFFTVDGALVHAVSCNAEAFASPMYPVLASGFDVMALVNLGQGKFRYAPANARRTANPCFVRAASSSPAVDARGGGGGEMMGLDFDDSGELFSMGRVDSGWMETVRMSRSRSRSRKESIGGSGAASVVGDAEAESDLFEIPLRD